MRLVIFAAKPYERPFFEAANRRYGHEIVYRPERLTRETASLAAGAPAVCIFVNDPARREVLEALAGCGVRLLALRSVGYDHVDLAAAQELGIAVANVPAYSPNAVAEHTVGLILALNRKLHRAYARVRDGNFSLGGLLGFDLVGRTVGIVGAGRIGGIVAQIMRGFGCRVLAFDPFVRPELEALGVRYVSLPELCAESDIVTLHCPLTPETHHLIDAEVIARMKEGVMLINVARGAVLDTRAALEALKAGRIGALGLDVYEYEQPLFFEDFSDQIVPDDLFARLLTFPNVLVTPHQGFFTREALENIAETTLANVAAFEAGRGPLHPVTMEPARR